MGGLQAGGGERVDRCGTAQVVPLDNQKTANKAVSCAMREYPYKARLYKSKAQDADDFLVEGTVSHSSFLSEAGTSQGMFNVHRRSGFPPMIHMKIPASSDKHKDDIIKKLDAYLQNSNEPLSWLVKNEDDRYFLQDKGEVVVEGIEKGLDDFVHVTFTDWTFRNPSIAFIS